MSLWLMGRPSLLRFKGAQLMKIVFLGLVGLFLGAMLGGVLGVIFGLVYVHVTHATAREGFAGMVVFMTFMPLGIILGGLLGAVGLGYLATRDVSPR
jgi:hypothetical protein